MEPGLSPFRKGFARFSHHTQLTVPGINYLNQNYFPSKQQRNGHEPPKASGQKLHPRARSGLCTTWEERSFCPDERPCQARHSPSAVTLLLRAVREPRQFSRPGQENSMHNSTSVQARKVKATSLHAAPADEAPKHSRGLRPGLPDARWHRQSWPLPVSHTKAPQTPAARSGAAAAAGGAPQAASSRRPQPAAGPPCAECHLAVSAPAPPRGQARRHVPGLREPPNAAAEAPFSHPAPPPPQGVRALAARGSPQTRVSPHPQPRPRR